MKRVSPRWLLVFIIPLGFVLTRRYLSGLSFEYFILSLLAQVSLYSLLLSLGALSVAESLPIWIILGAMMLYYFIQFYRLLIVKITPDPSPGFFASSDIDPELALRAYGYIVAGFVSFTVVSILAAPLFRRRTPKQTTLQRCDDREWASKAFPIARLLGLGLAFLQLSVIYKFKLIPGAPIEGSGLFWGVLAVFFQYCIPAGILLSCELAVRSGRPGALRKIVTSYIGYGIIGTLISSWKSMLVSPSTNLGLWWLARGAKLRRRHIFLMAIPAIFVARFFSPLEIYRGELGLALLQGERINYVSIFNNTLADWRVVMSLSGDVSSERALNRIIGANTLLGFLDSGVAPVGLSGFIDACIHSRSVNWYLELRVFGIDPANAPSVASPSWFGLCYYFGGLTGIVIGTMLGAGIVYAVWALFLRLPLLTRPVLQTSFLISFVMPIFQEGTLGSPVRYLAWFIMALTLELMCQWYRWRVSQWYRVGKS